MRIVHMTSVHPWNGPRIFHKMCRWLARAGHEVHLVAPRADGPELETRHGVHVHAVPPGRNRLDRVWTTRALILRTVRKLQADLYHFHDPELMPVGLALKAAGKRVVYDVHEDLPKQILTKEWIPRSLRRMVSHVGRSIEVIAARAFDGIVAATPLIARNFPRHMTAVVQNYPIPQELAVADSLPVSQRPPVLSYIGAITRARGIGEILAAMAWLPPSLDARLALAGTFESPRLEQELRGTEGWSRVDYWGWCDRQQIARLLATASVGLVTVLPAPNYVESQPLKLYEYMSAGLPVVASDFPLWRRIVSQAGCGLLVDPRNPQAIAEAVRWLFTHPAEVDEMGQRGRLAVAEKYNWQQEFPKLLKLYEKLFNQGRRPGNHRVFNRLPQLAVGSLGRDETHF